MTTRVRSSICDRVSTVHTDEYCSLDIKHIRCQVQTGGRAYIARLTQEPEVTVSADSRRAVVSYMYWRKYVH